MNRKESYIPSVQSPVIKPKISAPKPKLLTSDPKGKISAPKPKLLTPAPKPKLLTPKPKLLTPKPKLLTPTPKPKLLTPTPEAEPELPAWLTTEPSIIPPSAAAITRKRNPNTFTISVTDTFGIFYDLTLNEDDTILDIKDIFIEDGLYALHHRGSVRIRYMNVEFAPFDFDIYPEHIDILSKISRKGLPESFNGVAVLDMIDAGFAGYDGWEISIDLSSDVYAVMTNTIDMAIERAKKEQIDAAALRNIEYDYSDTVVVNIQPIAGSPEHIRISWDATVRDLMDAFEEDQSFPVEIRIKFISRGEDIGERFPHVTLRELAEMGYLDVHDPLIRLFIEFSMGG